MICENSVYVYKNKFYIFSFENKILQLFSSVIHFEFDLSVFWNDFFITPNTKDMQTRMSLVCPLS